MTCRSQNRGSKLILGHAMGSATSHGRKRLATTGHLVPHVGAAETSTRTVTLQPLGDRGQLVVTQCLARNRELAAFGAVSEHARRSAGAFAPLRPGFPFA